MTIDVYGFSIMIGDKQGSYIELTCLALVLVAMESYKISDALEINASDI